MSRPEDVLILSASKHNGRVSKLYVSSRGEESARIERTTRLDAHPPWRKLLGERYPLSFVETKVWNSRMLLFGSPNLADGFRKYFSIEAAVTPAQRDVVFNIRHQVYCEDLKFEPERADRRETDEHDAHSLHCLLRTAATAPLAVGCTRLVLGRADAPDYLLPFERACAQTLDRSIVDPARLPRDRIGEVSRLAVISAFRRRRGEARQVFGLGSGDYGAPSQPRFPYVPISLYLGVVALAARNQIDTLFLLTEPRLITHFGRLGVNIRQIGQPVMHRGARIPSMIETQEIINNLRPFLRPLWELIYAAMEPGTRRTAPDHSTPIPPLARISHTLAICPPR